MSLQRQQLLDQTAVHSANKAGNRLAKLGWGAGHLQPLCNEQVAVMFRSPQWRKWPIFLLAQNTYPSAATVHAAGGGGGTATGTACGGTPAATASAASGATGAAAPTASPPAPANGAAAGTPATACRLCLEDRRRSLTTFSSWPSSKTSFIPSSSTIPQQPSMTVLNVESLVL